MPIQKLTDDNLTKAIDTYHKTVDAAQKNATPGTTLRFYNVTTRLRSLYCRACANCSKPFLTPYKASVTCSPDCRRAHKTEKAAIEAQLPARKKAAVKRQL